MAATEHSGGQIVTVHVTTFACHTLLSLSPMFPVSLIILQLRQKCKKWSEINAAISQNVTCEKICFVVLVSAGCYRE